MPCRHPRTRPPSPALPSVQVMVPGFSRTCQGKGARGRPQGGFGHRAPHTYRGPPSGCRLTPLTSRTGCGDALGATNQAGASAGSSAPSSTGTSGAQRANRGISAARKTWSASGFGEAQPSQICPQRPHPLLRRNSERVFSSGEEGVATPQQVSPPPLLLGLQIRMVWTQLLAWTTQLVRSQASSGASPGLQAFSAGGGAGRS